MELGGAEIVAEPDSPLLRRTEDSGPRTESGRMESSVPDVNSMIRRAKSEGSPSSVPRPQSSHEPKWKRGAPPIPGPGLTVTLPTPSLLGDSIAELPTLEALAAVVKKCRKCPLCEGRTHAVPGEGHPKARLVLIGEGPGAVEDETGRPFVGPAGELLNGILAAIEIPREAVYIANIVKCRPPQNRKPLPDEVAACLPYLHRQLALIQPKVIVALGGTAAEGLLGVKKSLGDLRGKVHRLDGIPLVVTYHPAALLRNPNWKKPTWDDVRITRQLLDA